MKTQPQTITGCGVCGSTSARELYTARDRLSNSGELFAIAKCEGCGVLRTLPEIADAELARYYPDDYWGEAPEPEPGWIKSSQSEKTRFLDKVTGSSVLTKSNILDVGCGAGFFLRALDPKRWERFGVEVSQSAARIAERALGSGHVFAGALAESAWPDSTFHVVTLWSALEHTNQPRDNLIEARRIIKEGGSLIVQVPNAASYQSRAFAGDWFALDTPRHRYHFTLPVLERLLSETGFKVYRVSCFSKEHNSHALKHSLKLKLLSDDSSLIRSGLFYLSIPFLKPFDNLMSAFGKGATLTIAALAVQEQLSMERG